MRGEANDLDWSPDGRVIAFTRDDGIYVVKANGGRPRLLIGKDKAVKGLNKEIGDTPQLSWPAWSPDGKTLAFVKELPDFSSAIYVVGRDGRGARRLLPEHRGAVGDALPGSPFALSERDPSWSPDGREIAFQAGDGQIVTARVNDGRRRIIAEKASYEPAWSPDGKLIAYQCEGDLCLSNADGTGEARHLASDGGDPSWAPDSRQLVFEHYLYSTEAGLFTGDAQSLTLLDVSSGDSEKLTYGPDLPAAAHSR
jgi:Tol biopolymer transport system component